jgi:hypothetical protein
VRLSKVALSPLGGRLLEKRLWLLIRKQQKP